MEALTASFFLTLLSSGRTQHNDPQLPHITYFRAAGCLTPDRMARQAHPATASFPARDHILCLSITSPDPIVPIVTPQMRRDQGIGCPSARRRSQRAPILVTLPHLPLQRHTPR